MNKTVLSLVLLLSLLATRAWATISYISSPSKSSTSVTISWYSNLQESNNTVAYSQQVSGTCSLTMTATAASSCDYNHLLVVTGLAPNTTYCFRPAGKSCSDGSWDYGSSIFVTTNASDTPTVTPSSTRTPVGSFTASPTASPTRTDTPTRTPTATPTATRTITATFTDSPTATDSPTRTATPTTTSTRTASPTRTPTATRTPTISPTATPVPVSSSLQMVVERFQFTGVTPAHLYTFTPARYLAGDMSFLWFYIENAAGTVSYQAGTKVFSAKPDGVSLTASYNSGIVVYRVNNTTLGLWDAGTLSNGTTYYLVVSYLTRP